MTMCRKPNGPMVTAPAQPSPLPRPALDSHTHLDMMGLLGGPGAGLRD